MSPRGLLLRFLAFAVAFGAFVASVEARFRAIPTSYSQKHDWLEAHASQVEVLILGSSSALNGIQPKFFSDPHEFGAYNAGNTGQSLYYDHQILARYLGSMKRLKVVIVTIDYQTLEYRMSHYVESWRQMFYRRFFDFAPEGGVDPYDVRLVSVFQLYPPAFRTNCMFRDCDHNDEVDALGWADAPTTTVDDAPAWLERESEMLHPEFVPGNVALLEGDLAALQARGVKAALVVPPVASTFSKIVLPEVREKTKEVLAALASAHGGVYRDYFEDARFETKDFANAMHVNSTSGTEKFSRILDAEVVRPVLVPDAAPAGTSISAGR